MRILPAGASGVIGRRVVQCLTWDGRAGGLSGRSGSGAMGVGGSACPKMPLPSLFHWLPTTQDEAVRRMCHRMCLPVPTYGVSAQR
jgi:hypothetical protein